MSVGSKLAVLVWGIWALCLSLMIPIGGYLYRNTELELTFLTTLFSGIVVGSLVPTSVIWRTLRESQRKSLEIINQNALRSLWHTSNPNLDPYRLTTRDFEKPREYLKGYARFLGVISLHPIEWNRIDRLISLLEPFEKNIQQIDKLVEKEVGHIAHREQILKKLGFEPLYPDQMSPGLEKDYTRLALKLQREQPKLINNTKKLTEDLEKVRKEIHENLDNFLKENHLPLLTHWHTLQ